VKQLMRVAIQRYQPTASEDTRFESQPDNFVAFLLVLPHKYENNVRLGFDHRPDDGGSKDL
jgi:hypothetical protein